MTSQRRLMLAGNYFPNQAFRVRVHRTDAFETRDMTLQRHGDELAEVWRELLDAGASPEKVYQSRAYFEHLTDTLPDAESCILAVVYDSQKNIVGIIPVRKFRQELCLTIGRLRLATYGFNVVQILGSVPLFRNDAAELPATAFAYLLNRYPDCRALVMHTVPQKVTAQWRRLDGLAHHTVHGWRDCHVFPLPDSAESYLKLFCAKKRYNLVRQIRLLTQAVGKLELIRYTQAEQVTEFLAGLRAMPNGRQHWSDSAEQDLRSLARHGLMLCYVLRSETGVVAAISGTRGDEVWHIGKIYYDETYAHNSPGTSILHLAQQDLIKSRSIRRLDFGYGNPSQESRSHHSLEKRGRLLICRKLGLFNLALHAWTVVDTVNERLCACAKWMKKSIRAGAAGFRPSRPRVRPKPN